MKMPIRFKLLFYMTVSVLLFAVILFGFNMIFTKKIYISHKKSILIESSAKIQKIIESYPESEYLQAEFELSRLERIIGGSIFIGTYEGKIYYPKEWGAVGPPRRNPFFSK